MLFPITRRMPEVFGSLGGRVIELQREDARDRFGQCVEATGAEMEGPRVHADADVVARAGLDHRACAGDVVDGRARGELDGHPETVLGGAIAHTGQHFGGGIDGDVGPPTGQQDVDELGTHPLCRRENLIGGRLFEVRTAGIVGTNPRDERVGVMYDDAVVVEKCPHVAIGPTIGTSSLIGRGRPERQQAEIGLGHRVDEFTQRR